MALYKLTYFPVRARAEVIRLALSCAGVRFTDVRVDQKEWETLRSSERLPFGQLPILEFGEGKVLGQSKAILRFIGRQHGLTPNKVSDDDDFLLGQADMLVDQINDMEEKMISHHSKNDKTALDTLLQDTVPQLCSQLEHLLSENPKGHSFFVGDKITYADIAVFAFLNGYIAGGKAQAPVEISGYSVLSDWYNGVMNVPNILKWIQLRPANIMDYPY